MSHVGGLGHMKVLILHRQALIGPAGYERCDLHVEVYCWSYSTVMDGFFQQG